MICHVLPEKIMSENSQPEVIPRRFKGSILIGLVLPALACDLSLVAIASAHE
jgi:hypothetical protein